MSLFISVFVPFNGLCLVPVLQLLWVSTWLSTLIYVFKMHSVAYTQRTHLHIVHMAFMHSSLFFSFLVLRSVKSERGHWAGWVENGTLEMPLRYSTLLYVHTERHTNLDQSIKHCCNSLQETKRITQCCPAHTHAYLLSLCSTELLNAML